MDQTESFFNLYPKLGPACSKLLPFKCRKQKVDRQLKDQSIPSLNGKSLIKKYSDLCNKYSSKELELPHRVEVKNNKHSFSCQKDCDNSSLGMNGGNSNSSKRIVRVINSMQEYTEHLKSSMLGQYKKKKRKREEREILRKQEQLESRWSASKEKEINPEDDRSGNLLLTKYSSKGMVVKTINILYKAIIDDSFHKREKQEFQLQANQLPIIDRFTITKRRAKFLQADPNFGQATLAAFKSAEKRKTMLSMYQNHQTVVPREKERSEFRAPRVSGVVTKLREDVEIMPWTIPQDHHI